MPSVYPPYELRRTRGPLDRLNDVFNVRDFGAVGDGASDDTHAIRAACEALQSAGGGTLEFPPGTYDVFASTTGNLGTFIGLNGVMLRGHGATVRVNLNKTIVASEGAFFSFSGCSDVTIDGFRTDGPTLDVSQTTVKGYEFVRLANGCRNVNMPRNRVKNMIAGLICSRLVSDPESYRSQNIKIGVLEVVNTWYGVNNQYSGDFLTIDVLRSDTVHRSLFVYGCSRVRAEIWSKNCKANDVNISGFGGVPTEEISVIYHSDTESTACNSQARCAIRLFGNTAQTIRNVKLTLDIRYGATGDTGASAVRIEKFDNSMAYDTVDRGHVIDGLDISGFIDGTPSYNDGGVIVLYNGCTWGAADFFYRWNFHDLTITGAAGAAFVNIGAESFADWIALRNIKSTSAVSVRSGTPSNYRAPSTGKRIVENVSCTNLNSVATYEPIGRHRPPNTTQPINLGWQGQPITNIAVGAAVVMNLPASVVGMKYGPFIREDARIMDIAPNGTEIIGAGTAGQKLRLNALGNLVSLECFVAGRWEVTAVQGAVSYV